MTPTPQQAWELLCEYNEGEFHRKHSRIVGDVLRWYAETLGYGEEADFWEAVGILHDAEGLSDPLLLFFTGSSAPVRQRPAGWRC